MQSCLYIGSLRHRRISPRRHSFRYRLAMIYVDLAELDTVFRGRWLWSTRRFALARLKRSDYLGDPTISLDSAVRDCVASDTGCRPTGPVRMLTHLRYFGICFNPVTFYYCFDPGGTRVESLVAQVTNTPWNERHCYVLHAAAENAAGVGRCRFEKQFHVSPFMQMDIDYDWHFTKPDKALGVHVQSLNNGRKLFDATLLLRRREISGPSLAMTLLAFPAETLKVLIGIYWQALRLLLKRVPLFTHPNKLIPIRKAANKSERIT